MKISYKDIGFEKALNRTPKKLKAPKKPNILFKTLLKIVSIFDLHAVSFKANKIGMNKLNRKQLCMILMNHSSFF